MELPEPDEVRRQLADLDEREEKIVAGLFALMIREPGRVRDREWLLERLTQAALLSSGAEESEAEAGEDLGELRGYLEEHHARLLAASFLLFQRVGTDLAPRAAAGFTLEEALAAALGYLPRSAGD